MCTTRLVGGLFVASLSLRSFSMLLVSSAIMPVSCAADGCTNRWFKGCEVRFFRFPDDDDERRRHAWSRGACPRREAKWQPSKHMRVCSAHFVSGNKCDDPMDVDWAPSVIGIRSRGMEVGRMNKERHERAKRRASSPALLAPPSKQPSSNISGCSQLGESSKVPTQDECEAAPPWLQAEIVALREKAAARVWVPVGGSGQRKKFFSLSTTP